MSSSPLPDEAQLLPQLHMASGLEVKLYSRERQRELIMRFVLFKHTRVSYFRLTLIWHYRSIPAWITSITWFLSNQLHHPRLALISNWLTKDKNSYLRMYTYFKKRMHFTEKLHPRCSVQSVCMYPHHIGVWGVGQSERSSIVFLLQLSLFEEQLNEPIADLSTPLQSLGVHWMLHDKQQGLVPNLMYHSLVQQCQDRLIHYQSIRGVDTYVGKGFLVILSLWGKDYVITTCTISYFKIK